MSQGDSEPVVQDPLAFLAGGGQMGERTRALDWSDTPLGPASQWPQSLRSALSICLNASFPIALYWGRDLVLLYNDDWSSILGEKHPWALGRPAREAWPEIWAIIAPLFEQVLTTGEATRRRDQLLPMHRHGFTEECYFDYTFSPIRGEGGAVDGVFNAVLETTTRVIGERRLRTLRLLGDHASEAKTAEAACEVVASTLATNPHDLPFALLYLLDADGRRATLAGFTGLGPETSASPASVSLEAESAVWPFRQVVETGKAVEVDHLPDRFGPLPGGAWPESAQRAVVLPMAKPGQDQLAGFVVAGVSPRLAFNDDYRTFMELLAGHVATAVANARAHEEERKRAEALAELDRAKTAFFSNVSHEFRTPLTLMLGPVEELLARSHTDLSPAAAGQLEVVNRNGMRLLRLVNTLLDFSRIEAGRVRATFQPTDLAAFTADLASVFRSACERAGLKLVVECSPLAAPVFVDRDMWEKIVLNLLSNAFKFTFEGEIAVSLRRNGDVVELRVQDTGTGIPAEEMPRLFERFHRVQQAAGRTHEGSGIGLALVQELVKLHGGSVTVESVVGEGSEFIVALPLGKSHLPPDQIGNEQTAVSTGTGATPYVEEALRWLPDLGHDRPELPTYHEPLPTPHRSSTPGVHGERPRVLFADDNADMRQYVVRLLAEQFEVETAPDGEAALIAARQRPPALILTDVMMPRLDGFGLLRELRSDPRTRDIPIIMLSARAGEESRVEGMQAGADDYLVKPFSARELIARVSAHVQMARLRREASESLRRSEERLAAILEQLPVGVSVMDFDGRLTQLNPIMRRFVPERIPSLDPDRRHRWRAVGPGGLPLDLNDWPGQRALRGEPVVPGVEFLFTDEGGQDVWTNVATTPLRDAEGTVVGAVVVIQDITERKRAELLQAGQKQVLEMVATGRPLPEVLAATCRVIEEQEPGLLCSVLVASEDGTQTDLAVGPGLPGSLLRRLEGLPIAPPYLAACGEAMDCGEVIAAPDLRNDVRFEPAWRELLLSHGLQSCLSIPVFGSKGKVLASFVVHRRTAGELAPVNERLAGIAAHLAGIAIERRRAEQRLRESEQRHRKLFDANIIGVMTVMPDGRILDANDAFLDMVGRTRTDLEAGRLNWKAMTPPEVLADEQEYVRSNPPIHGRVAPYEKEFLRADGRRVPVLLGGAFLHGDSGEGICFVLDITERKRAEQEVRRARSRLAATLTAGEIGTWEFDVRNNIVRADPNLARIMNLTPEDAEGGPLEAYLRAIHADDRANVDEAIRRSLASGEQFESTARVIDPDDGVRWIIGRGQVDRDEAEQTVHLRGVVIDITRQRQAETQLRVNEERLRSIFAQTLAGIAETDLSGQFIHVNQRYCEIVRRTAEELAGLRMQDITHPDDLPINLPLFTRAVTDGTPFSIEKRYVRPDGSLVWVNNSVSLVRGERGEPRSIVAVCLDITDRRRAEQALRDSEALFRSMADSAPAMLWVTDASASCTYISRQWCEYTGTTPEQNLGAGWLNCVHPDDAAPTKVAFLKASQQHAPFNIDYRLRRHDGEYRWAIDAGLPRFEGDNFVGYVGCVFDVHDRKQGEEALREADRQKDEFLSILAHELRNPLAPLRNGLQVMKLAKSDSSAAEQARTMMERQLGQMVRLIDDLMDLTRISRGKVHLQKTRLPIATAVQNAVETSRPLIEQQGHALVLQAPNEPIYVEADEIRLSQVFANLLNNAAKYTDPGGRICLTVAREGDTVAVTVEDNGVGIPAHMLPKVFDMFTQVDRSLEKSQGGLGIGLNIVKRLVEMHGGEIEVHSEGHGKGSRFVVRLPVALAVVGDEGPSTAREPRAATKRRRILVVDDNRDAALSLAMMLKIMGNETQTAHDGLEALDVAAAFQPDVILLDIGMPRLNGYETARRIRNRSWGKRTTLIALTGWGQDEDRNRSRDAGFDAHLVKPIEPAALEELLAGLQTNSA